MVIDWLPRASIPAGDPVHPVAGDRARELHLLRRLDDPLGWLERVPT